MIEFDTNRVRSNVEIDIMTLNSKGLNRTGLFKPLEINRLTFYPQAEDTESQNETKPINQMTFKVIVAMVCF